MANPVETSNCSQSTRPRCYSLITAFLGWLGAVNSLLIGFFILSTCLAYSSIPPMDKLLFQAYLAITLTAASSLMLVYGSYLIWKTNGRKGGVINILAGTVIPIPVYAYFTFLSQPAFLQWLGPVGYFLLAPGIMSGIISILT